MLDVNIIPLALDVQPPPEGSDVPTLGVAVTAGLILPIDQGNGQPAIIPAGTIRFPLDKDAALNVAKQLEEAAEQLPDQSKSDITIAKDLNDVERVAEADRAFRG